MSRLTETELLPARTAAKVVHVVVLFLARHRTEETVRALERAEQWARAQRGLEKAETFARACAAARAAP